MKHLIAVTSAIALVGVMSGCAEHRRVTTTRQTIETAPMDPVVTERRTTTHTETRTGN